MKKRPFLMASMTIGAIFLFFLLVVFTAGIFSGRTVVVPVGKKIGILEVYGTIIDAQKLIEQIGEFRDSAVIKAVVLRIDSPGGGVAPSQEIHAELLKLAKEKPLVVSMGAIAASGGYYLAVAGERLFANPGSITGSIGVIMSFPDFRELMGKIGVKTEVVKSGQFKDIGSPSREFTDLDRELLQGMIDDVHAQFVQAISEGRNLPVDRLRPFVDGRIFTGRQALEIGLVDELGTFNDAIDYAAKVSGVGEKPDLVYPDPGRENFIEKLIQGAANRYLGVDVSRKPMIGPQYLWQGY
ncbi:signal peptide peptidase SppA [Malonomonas rubra]|uniref:signal peptide peptidase SppA n=1 Tax=Malonomonas rubra TaxID=57040 RepID=UPI0026F2FA46|nr:signal peptide peptidase SppA [Malonomonas rubra]